MIQIVGIVVGLMFVYLTHLYFRRREFNVVDFLIWVVIWISIIFGALFPNIVNSLVGELGFLRALDLFTIFGFLIIVPILFYLYIIVKRNNKKIEEFVRKEALEKVKK